MLFDLHGNRAGPYVNVNHLCVTLGGALIALYVIFLDLLWRSAVVQAGLAVAIMAVVFALTRLPVKGGQATLQAKVRIITNSRIVAVLFVCSLLTIGASAATTGMLSTFLAEQRGVAPVTAKLGLVIFLAGVAAGRIVIGAFARPNRLYRMLVILFALSTGMFALLFLVDLGPLTLLAVFLAGLTLSAQLPFLLTYAGLAYPCDDGHRVGRDQNRHPARRHRHAAPDRGHHQPCLLRRRTARHPARAAGGPVDDRAAARQERPATAA